jgi:DedD protein
MLKSRAAERSAPDESVEAVRRRARYRLVGALVLVVVGVIAFPLVFDTQPRPVDEDLAIIIPDKNTVAPLTVSPPVAQDRVVDASAGRVPPAAQPAPVAPSNPEPKPEPKAEAQANAQAEPEVKTPPAAPKPEARAEVKPEPKPEPKSEPKPEPKVAKSAETKPAPTGGSAQAAQDEAARARAILEGRTSAIQANGKWVVQVGSYGDPASVKRVRRMLEAGGLKTFTQVVKTSQGELTRVRLGPYASDGAAEQAQAKAKSLGFASAKLLKL